MSTLDMFPDLPRRLTHEEIIAGFAELLRAVEAMQFWEPWTRKVVFFFARSADTNQRFANNRTAGSSFFLQYPSGSLLSPTSKEINPTSNQKKHNEYDDQHKMGQQQNQRLGKLGGGERPNHG
jgi:hypothetical protein